MERKLSQALGLSCAALAGLLSSASLVAPAKVEACGGLFCSSNRAIAVNQAAEQIIFSKNADGTVTAVIQIMYEGTSSKFAWVLPVPGVPKVAVSSDQAFVALKQQTNPSFQLQYQSTCARSGAFGNSGPSAGTSATPPATMSPGSAVTVLASGAIGPYDYDTISVNPSLSDRAQVAVDWLTMHGYDVGPMGADVLRPYLMNDLNLIAFKLTKDSSTGSIRPVMLTYTSDLPSIPIRPTAVAANDDMGVLVWVLSDKRAIPQNYKALELNEALIDWFNPNNNYNRVVSLAADEAMGQGFVTEFAGKTVAFQSSTGNGIFASYQKQQWDTYSNMMYTDSLAMIRDASAQWGMWDGFDDALQAAVTLPTTIEFKDFKNCLACYLTATGVTFDRTVFLTKLYEMVIKPMADTQALFDSANYMTRLYTTMSADEMTTDPAFDFNPDLGDVSNLHTAMIDVGCGSGAWTATMPLGDKVVGSMTGVWPIKVGDQPAARKILEYGKQGEGKVVDDRSAMITKLIKDGANAAPVDAGTSSGTAGSGTVGGGKAGSGTTTGSAGSTGTTTRSDAGVATSGGAGTKSASSDTVAHSSGCSVGSGQPSSALSWLLVSSAALLTRRRRR